MVCPFKRNIYNRTCTCKMPFVLILVLLQFYSLIICICELQGFGGKTLDLFFSSNTFALC